MVKHLQKVFCSLCNNEILITENNVKLFFNGDMNPRFNFHLEHIIPCAVNRIIQLKAERDDDKINKYLDDLDKMTETGLSLNDMKELGINNEFERDTFSVGRHILIPFIFGGILKWSKDCDKKQELVLLTQCLACNHPDKFTCEFNVYINLSNSKT